MPDTIITVDSIKGILASYIDTPDQSGFEVYMIIGDDSKLKRIVLDDKQPEEKKFLSFKKQIRDMLLRTLGEKFCSPDVEYAYVSMIADRQQKMYLIPQSEEMYHPFSFLGADSQEFQERDIEQATGIAFAYSKEGTTLWLYQHLWPVLVPNKKKSHMMARILKFENGFEFHEQKESLLIITQKVDLVIINGIIITSDISLMQKVFGFQDYIRRTADRIVERVAEHGIVANTKKIYEYMNRGNGKLTYAKKILRIHESIVLKLTPAQLIDKIRSLPRWRNAFILNVANDAIELETYVQVENLIDLLDERFIKSEVTNTEYDTDVKREAKPIKQETT